MTVLTPVTPTVSSLDHFSYSQTHMFDLPPHISTWMAFGLYTFTRFIDDINTSFAYLLISVFLISVGSTTNNAYDKRRKNGSYIFQNLFLNPSSQSASKFDQLCSIPVSCFSHSIRTITTAVHIRTTPPLECWSKLLSGLSTQLLTNANYSTLKLG